MLYPIYATEENRKNPRYRIASNLVAAATASAIYDVDRQGYPLNIDLRQLLFDATEAQVEFWESNDLDPTKLQHGSGSASSPVESKTMGPVSVKYADSQEAIVERSRALTSLAPHVSSMLAGLSSPARFMA